MKHVIVCSIVGWITGLGLLIAVGSPRTVDDPPADALLAGFAEADVTPEVKGKTVYLAGFGQNRKATGVHDPLLARAIVLRHRQDKLAIVSVDVVGLFYETVLRIREKLPGFRYVLVSSTHNHEGPDTLGLWGPNPFQSGVDPAYMAHLEAQIVKAVKDAEAAAVLVTARIGTVRAPELLHDSRLPIVKHDDLVALRFDQAGKDTLAGVVVQWNCHPETLDSKNTLVSADYVAGTVGYLKKRLKCPVVYLTGTVGGLMTSLRVPVKDDKGQDLKDGTFEKTERYGELVGRAAEEALARKQAKPLRLTPMQVLTREIFLPMDNKLYHIGWQLGVLKRQAFTWTGNPEKAEPLPAGQSPKGRMCIRTELGLLRLGELEVACIPGEIYPELVLGKVEDPAPEGADFPEAPIEPAIYAQMKGPHRMIIGLANDEIGYILPKRQWDEKAPFCYGRKKAQYGEVNSLGPDTGPLLCAAFKELAAKGK